MRLLKLNIQGFRSYDSLNYVCHEGLNLFVGDNGAGKTNLLDAIYYSALGKSYFSGIDRDVIKNGATFMRLQYMFLIKDEKRQVVIKWSPQNGKALEYGENVINRLSDYVGTIKVVMMAPQDAFVLLIGNTERRRWINQFLSQSINDHAYQLKQYNLLLKRRNAYLKDTPDHKIEDELMDAYWSQMRPFAQAIYESRKKAIEELSGYAQYYYKELSNEAESISINYISVLDDTKWEEMKGANRRVEMVTGSTHTGIHKDKIEFLIGGKPLKYYGSQGQTKSFFLSLKLAEYEFLKTKGDLPIILVDDVFAKLDSARIERFFKVMRHLDDCQIFITDTDGTRLIGLLEKLNMPGKMTAIRNTHLYDYEDEQE